MLRWVKRHRKSASAAGLLTAVSVAPGVLAVSYDGFTTTDVDLHDGGVWVTKAETLQLGHLNVQANVQAEASDGAVASPSNSFDVLQSGNDVLLLAHDSSSALVIDPVRLVTGSAVALPPGGIDPVRLVTGSAVALPPGGEITMGGGSVAITDPESGLLWALRIDQLTDFAASTTEPTLELELERGLVAAAGLDGTVHAASPESGTQATPLRDRRA